LSLLILKPLNTKPKEKSGGTWYIISSRSEKVGDIGEVSPTDPWKYHKITKIAKITNPKNRIILNPVPCNVHL